MTAFTPQITAAILAGLRLLEREIDNSTLNPEIADIATSLGEFEPLPLSDIDTLCEMINTQGLMFHSLLVSDIIPRLEAILDDEDLGVTSATGEAIEDIIIHCARPSSPKAAITPSDIKIYAVHTTPAADLHDAPFGFSLDPEPGSADTGARHLEIDAQNPGADLHLYCFQKPEHAAAFREGLALFRADQAGIVTKTYSQSLTAVLVEFFDSASNQLIINTDHLTQSPTSLTERY